MTEAEVDEAFAAFLTENSLSPCKCGRHIDRADVAWNNGETEYGTPYSYVEIQCLGCQEEIASWSSWIDFDSFEDVVDIGLKDYEPNGRRRA